MTIKLDCAESLEWLRSRPDGIVDLCYIDPPFFSQRDYGEFDDHWKDINEYGCFVYERLLQIRRVLKPTGSIYVHCDETAGHHIRLLMDNVFGPQNWKNTIVWSYKRWTASKKTLPRLHDTILFYSKTDDFTFHLPMIPNDNPNPSQYVSAKDKNGKTVTAKDENGKPIKREVAKEIQVGDVWYMPILSPVAKERCDYPTQKPLALLDRIILASSNPGDLVMDCFLGSGTTAVSAVRNGRDFIGCDINPKAIEIAKRRIEV